MEKDILSYDDLLDMLDDFLREPKPFWESFYEDRKRDIPFFKVKGPDENLAEYVENGLKPQRVLELGRGPGRNAIFMAQNGARVDAIDLSAKAIDWARERAFEAEIDVNFVCTSLFDFKYEPHTYDFIYDCGMFHHLPPHRRLTYRAILKRALKPGGQFGLVCFNTDGALGTSDWDVYRIGSLKRGIGYSEERLKANFMEEFDIMQFRRMKKIQQPSEVFGEDFLWACLMRIK
ncbi:class I SAM-dependent methyltransferase [Bacillus sp. ISL-47]|uniref:class I SAM-dependent methyltransferase n=1 Tax=Bacillus sp. ISL-47 TaxID=2819130 RepID=UPI001BE67D6D|nr:class I SAM-dependent methyltransferase [Bacillus sp. ISL-47]MBT2686671.1 class I SAM-dependent methyltransferase [Bacillus sp. ISL-47]MBT2707063.1 class I SAM-dependent methyltransferase [Pseudomonas sp. ISL-84]